MKLSEKLVELRKAKGMTQDELTLGEVKEVHSCGDNAVQGKKQEQMNWSE